MDIEELKKDLPEEKVKALEEIVGERDKLKEDNEKLGKDIEAKDEVIAQKNNDIVGTRKEMQKLKELTEEEREQMSQKEIELYERQRQADEEREQERQAQKEKDDRERNARIDKAIQERVGDDPKLQEKLRENIERIKDSENAWTEDEIAKVANDGFNLLGEERPENPVSHAATQEGGEAGSAQNNSNFAETEEGKGLAANMGLSSAQQEGQPEGGKE